MKQAIKFGENEINLSAAYQIGRVDALIGDEPTRFSGKPFTGKGSTPDFHCAVTKTEAAAWPKIREQYLAGYKSQKTQISKPAVKL